MKKSINAISPFIILLLPALLIIGLLVFNPAPEQEDERLEAAACLTVPALINVTQELLLK